MLVDTCKISECLSKVLYSNFTLFLSYPVGSIMAPLVVYLIQVVGLLLVGDKSPLASPDPVVCTASRSLHNIWHTSCSHRQEGYDCYIPWNKWSEK